MKRSNLSSLFVITLVAMAFMMFSYLQVEAKNQIGSGFTYQGRMLDTTNSITSTAHTQDWITNFSARKRIIKRGTSWDKPKVRVTARFCLDKYGDCSRGIFGTAEADNNRRAGRRVRNVDDIPSDGTGPIATATPTETNTPTPTSTPAPIGSSDGNVTSAPAITSISRPFSDDSPWNTAIGRNPSIDPNSDAMIAAMDPDDKGFWINMDWWTIPVYLADAHTPTYDISCDNPSYSCEPGFGQNVPIPDDAMPDPSSDAHLAVADLTRQLSWDMYDARPTSTGWVVWNGHVIDLSGTGVRPDCTGSARASGFPLLAGLIRLEEIQQGYIPHALVMAFNQPRANVFVYPASINYGAEGGANTIPMGGHIQLDPTLDLDSLSLSPAGKTIARALQEYGAYVGDGGSNIAVFAEGLYGKPGLSWDRILDTHDLQTIPLQHYRVLELPPLKYNASCGY